MPRQPREKSMTGIYHVMMRGIDKRDIFVRDDDYETFLRCIGRARDKSGFSIYAFCLMTNHVHLLIKEGNEAIGESIKRINVGYVQIHNNIYGRTGHLFQNRFLSEPVNNDPYLLVVLRYIHQNPVKSGVVREISHYKWSSYPDYLAQREELIDTEVIMGYFGSFGGFIEFNEKKNHDNCLDCRENTKYSDDELSQVIKSIIEPERLKELKPEARDEFIKRIKNETGASARQLERIIGISRNTILKK